MNKASILRIRIISLKILNIIIVENFSDYELKDYFYICRTISIDNNWDSGAITNEQ